MHVIQYQLYHCTLLPPSHLTHLHSPPIPPLTHLHSFPSSHLPTHLYSPPSPHLTHLHSFPSSTFPHTCTLLPSSHLTHIHSSFLQLVLKNTCPLPIALTDPMIATELELTHLHEEMPAVSSGMGVAIWENVQVLSCDHYFARCCALMRVTLVSGKLNQVGMSHDGHMTVT